MGAHFGFWVSSLDYTSAAASVVLVCTQPIFVALLAYLVFGGRTSPLSPSLRFGVFAVPLKNECGERQNVVPNVRFSIEVSYEWRFARSDA